MVKNDFKKTRKGFVLTKEAKKRELARIKRVFEKEEERKAKIAQKKLKKELMELKKKRIKAKKEAEMKAKKRRKKVTRALKRFFKVPKLSKIRL